jgi:hypothetical protein
VTHTEMSHLALGVGVSALAWAPCGIAVGTQTSVLLVTVATAD